MTNFEYQSLRDNTVIHNAVINVTDNCNLRCPYCFTKPNKRVIDMETMKAAINFVLNECKRTEQDVIPNIYFFGGEPMMQFEQVIVPTVEWTEKSGIRDKYKIQYGMTTNGTLLSEKSLDWLANHGVNILLSIDGDKVTQDSQRPGPTNSSSFDLLAPKLPLILKYFPAVTFRSTIEPYNAERIYENYLFARDSNFQNFYLTPNIFAEWSINRIVTALEQLSFIADKMYQDISKGNRPLVWNELVLFMQSCFSEKKAKKIELNHCGIGIDSVGIAANGDINGCQEHNTYHEHDMFYIGNVFDGINEERHRQLLTTYQSIPHPVCREEPSLCEKCSFYVDCVQHFCPSHNLLMGRGAAENTLVTCMWNKFVKDLAFILLERIVAEKNDRMVRFLENA